MILTLAVIVIVAAFLPRCKRARRGDRVHVLTLIIRERYNDALARESARIGGTR